MFAAGLQRFRQERHTGRTERHDAVLGAVRAGFLAVFVMFGHIGFRFDHMVAMARMLLRGGCGVVERRYRQWLGSHGRHGAVEKPGKKHQQWCKARHAQEFSHSGTESKGKIGGMPKT